MQNKTSNFFNTVSISHVNLPLETNEILMDGVHVGIVDVDVKYKLVFDFLFTATDVGTGDSVTMLLKKRVSFQLK